MIKRTFIPLCALAVAAVASAQDYRQADQYLQQVAKGNISAQTAAPSTAIKADQVETARQHLWQQWVQALKTNGETRLPADAPLSTSATGSLAIPDSLEPNAVMPFYWGTKGVIAQSERVSVPTFIDLHGSGPKAHEWEATLSWAQRFADGPSRYFIPQIPQEGKYYRWWQRSKQWAWSWLWRRLMADAAIDPDRVYLFGVSEGGYGSQRLASFYADYLAAAGPMAGGEPLQNAPAENLGHVGFSLLTGEKDLMFCRNQYTRNTGLALDSLERVYPGLYTHRVELIPGKGHGFDYSPTTTWLMQFRRNARPTHFIWEDYEMDGLHRHGFYNLRVDQRPSDSLRTRYDVRIGDDGVIDIEARLVEYIPLEKDPRWQFTLRWHKQFKPATGGQFTLFLDNDLGGLDRKITVRVNGKVVFKGKPKTDLKYMAESIALYGDPRRVFPAAITVKY